MISEINRISDKSRQENAIDKVYKWYNDKILTTYIDKLTKSRSNSPNRAMNNDNNNDNNNNDFNYEANFDGINELDKIQNDPNAFKSTIKKDINQNKYLDEPLDNIEDRRFTKSVNNDDESKLYTLDDNFRETKNTFGNMRLDQYIRREEHNKINNNQNVTSNDGKVILHRDIESRQRVERMISRIDKRKNKEDEEKEFQDKIKNRLQEWNLKQNRIQEEQLKRYEANKFGNRFEDRINTNSNNKSEDKMRMSTTKLFDPNNNMKTEENVESRTVSRGILKRPISEKVRRLRENNAKILGININTENDDNNDEVDQNVYSNLLLSYSHNDLLKNRYKSYTNILDTEE